MQSGSAKRFPLRAIVARFSHEMPRQVIERVMRHYPFDFCATIAAEYPKPFSGLPDDAQEWFASGKIRGCEYDVQWDTLVPLDAEIIESMRDAEAVFMDTIARLEWKRSIPYATRKRWYLRHLRFWNDYLTRNRINFYLSAWIPHEIPDVLLYGLCKARGIPMLHFNTTMLQDVSFAASVWEDPAPRLREGYEALCRAYGDRSEDITLEPDFEKRYQLLSSTQAQKPAVERVRRSTEADRIQEMARRRPLTFLRHGLGYLTPRGLHALQGLHERRAVIRKRNAFYNTHAIRPPMDRPFVYLPLHFQPEASTTPMAGCFTDQILVAQMLNACLPDDILLYVKEHPRESGWTKRSVEDYQELLSLKHVRLIARDVDTFTLRENCLAVATCSGSAGFEAIFRQKPVFLFGNRFYEYVHGVFRIRTIEDCRRAVHAVFTEETKPTATTARLFMKAIQDTGVRASLHPLYLHVTDRSTEEHTETNAAAILSELDLLQDAIASASTAHAETGQVRREPKYPQE